MDRPQARPAQAPQPAKQAPFLVPAARAEDGPAGAGPESSSYLAYGAAETSQRSERWGNERDPYRFGGKEEDLEVGLSYFGARYYSPFLGAWLSADPVTVHELGSDTNPYSYVHGSPLMGVDPDGRELILAVLGIIAISAALGGGASVAAQAVNVGWSNIDWGWKGVAGAAAVGAVAGAVTSGLGGLFGESLSAFVTSALTSALGETAAAAVGGAATGVALGAIGGAASYLTSAGVTGSDPTWSGVGMATLTGAMSGGAGGAAGGAVGGGFGGALLGGPTGAASGYGLGLAFGEEFGLDALVLSLGSGLAGAIAAHGAGKLAPGGGDAGAATAAGGDASSAAADAPAAGATPDPTPRRALLLVADGGKLGDLLTRAANTEADLLRAHGWTADVVQVRSFADAAVAMGAGPKMSIMSIYSHAGRTGLALSGKPGLWTNITTRNPGVGGLPNSNLTPDAVVLLYGCRAGVGERSIAQALATHLGRTVRAWTSGSHFKSNNGYAPIVNGHFPPPDGTGPIYSRPNNGKPLRTFQP